MRPAGAMTARAVLATELTADGRSSRLSVLRSQGFLVLRPANASGPEPLVSGRRDVARVALAAGTAGPLGGDDFALDVHVGPASTLVLSEISAMLVLPGSRGGRSRLRITVRVDENATFVWIPKPVIAARGCDHEQDVQISLHRNARMVMREETLLGRHREAPGNLRTTLRISCEGRPLYHQQLRVGPDAEGSGSAAVLGESRAVGSVIAVDPAWTAAAPAAAAFHPDAVLTPLPGPGVLISAATRDSLQLRQVLDLGLETLGAPWRPLAAGLNRDSAAGAQFKTAG
ncbi:urease accessory protein UreD [Hoeflea sp. YIM 152468]|uniref:urease accessory protein UreD n=1 Tax=Hoeflea sp. YIM 152468 TaxID=3031759 RepID=UPI0023DC2023|nr:urease accessory protein UreD [Hoeflea sp. YIM 152468]MDF1608519.1 urease accessory protein UreD [Hoeflea sp. YIM 152468]